MPLQTWRILLPRLADSPMELDEELFQALLNLEHKQQQSSVKWDELSSWSVNQTAGSLTLFFDDETELNCHIQIIGTFDNDTFMWAWHNPSVRDELKKDSLRLKEYGVKRGWSLFSEPSFPATLRDGYAIMALAAQLFDSEAAYAGRSGETVTYLSLYDLPESAQHCEDPPALEPASTLETLNRILSHQIDRVQLSLSDLREIENICRRGYVQSQAGDHLAAAQSFDEAWEKLGNHASDQEPASWIKLAKGNALFLAGQMTVALDTLIQAERLYACPDLSLLYQRMGQCYAALGEQEKSIDMLAKVYVARGAAGLAELKNTERDPFEQELEERRSKARNLIAAAKQKRQDDQQLDEAAAIVGCLITELNSFELDAHKWQEQARESRTMVSQLCDKDLEARERMNSSWTWLMAVWCTPVRLPCCTSIQFPPAHDPLNEKLERVQRKSDGRIDVETTAVDSFDLTNNWRYELVEVDGALRISQIYSVWDDEEFPCI